LKSLKSGIHYIVVELLIFVYHNFVYIKHKFVKNTNMSIQHLYIRAYGPTVSSRDKGIPQAPDLDPYTDLPCTLAEGANSTTTAGCTTTPRQGQGRYQYKTIKTSAIGNVSMK
jgi:hypothetical protein